MDIVFKFMSIYKLLQRDVFDFIGTIFANRLFEVTINTKIGSKKNHGNTGLTFFFFFFQWKNY